MRHLSLLVLLVMSPMALSDTQEVFGTCTGLSQATEKNPASIHLQMGFVDPVRENFGIRYEYAYARLHDQKNNWRNDRRDSVDVVMHSFMLGAQQDLGHSMIAFSGMSYSIMRGSFNLENRVEGGQTFPYEARFVHIQTGFGNRWKFGDRYSVGIDWLVFSIYFDRHLDLHDTSRLVEYKGPYYEPKQEIKSSLDSITAIRTLGFRLSLFL